MQLSRRHTVYCWLLQYRMVGNILDHQHGSFFFFSLFTDYIIYVIWWWSSSRELLVWKHPQNKNGLFSHVESITSTNTIICLPRGTETKIVYCLSHLFPLNDGVGLLPLLFRERANTGHHGTAAKQPLSGTFQTAKQPKLSLSLLL